MNLRTAAIIQARMGSTRLPGKVLMQLQDRSLLGYLVERLKASESIDTIIVATTRLPQDDVIVEEATRLGLAFFRGSELDVLGRYAETAHAFKAEIIVRVTADNPLTDPESIDRVVRRIQEGADYSIEDDMPVGTTGEALSMDALQFLQLAATTPHWREHVTLFAKENPKLFRSSRYPAPADCSRPDLSFTVDTTADYLNLKALCEQIPHPQFPLKDVISLADKTVVV